jgi:DNA-binding MarR family transcriptional regulator
VALATSLEALLSWARRLAPSGTLSLTATATLARLSREGPSGVTALAAAEGVSQPAMSQLVARLEREGLVSRGGSPDDRRSVLVRLTPEGQRVVRERRAARAAALAALLEQAPPEDAALVGAALPALLRLARASAHSTPAPPSPSSPSDPVSPVRTP